ncbi:MULTISPECIES: hypothetical protein [unclassified Bradyrhizobium]|uniref:hypothetical protein n=1 Tax=unclassified Bradyrhizobium TaxID=2631580 RepID=UPI0028EC2216|nr:MULTISPECIES: hypothetical protein [unclassified Bradyrhizobium]
MSMVGFPLLLIPLAIYNMIAFLMPGVGFGETLVQVRLVSGETWTVSLGDILLALGVLLLWLEVIKAARPHGKYLTDHLLSLLVAGGAAAEFVMWPKFGNSTFFLLALLAMVDFFAGVGLRTKRRRAAAVLAAAPVVRTEPVLASASKPEPAKSEPAKAEPEPQVAESAGAADVPGSVVPAPAAYAEPEPAPAPPDIEVPAAAAVAESVLMAHPDPRIATPAATEPAPNAGAPDQAKEHEQAPAAPKP